MNITDPATVTIDAKTGIVCAFCDGPNGRATRVKIWPATSVVESGEAASIDIDFANVASVVQWFTMNATTIGRIDSLLKAKDAGNN